MKWLKLLSLALLLGCLSTPVAALAANPVVNITVSAWVVGAPSGLTITYVSDYQVDLSWVKGEGAFNTMVRAKYGSAPASRTDGYEVYYGDGTTCSDTGVNFDESAATVYYSLYSQNAAGVWAKEGISGLLENPNMMLIGLLFLAVSLMVSGLVLKKGYLCFSAAGGWMLVAVLALTNMGPTFDIYWGLLLVSCGLVITLVFTPLSFREAAGEDEDEDPDMADLRRFREEQQREQEQYGFLFGGSRSRHNRPGKTLYRNPPRR